MRKFCANCFCVFEPDPEFYALCGKDDNDCWNKVGRPGDEIAAKMWYACGTLVNLPLDSVDFELLSDSPAMLRFMEKMLEFKDLEMRRLWLTKEARKIV
jgi:hypothetical protein